MLILLPRKPYNWDSFDELARETVKSYTELVAPGDGETYANLENPKADDDKLIYTLAYEHDYRMLGKAQTEEKARLDAKRAVIAEIGKRKEDPLAQALATFLELS